MLSLRPMSLNSHPERDYFIFRRNPMPLLLILDRRDDPVTPLLSQWCHIRMRNSHSARLMCTTLAKCAGSDVGVI
jgi:hypothetical protein